MCIIHHFLSQNFCSFIITYMYFSSIKVRENIIALLLCSSMMQLRLQSILLALITLRLLQKAMSKLNLLVAATVTHLVLDKTLAGIPLWINCTTLKQSPVAHHQSCFGTCHNWCCPHQLSSFPVHPLSSINCVLCALQWYLSCKFPPLNYVMYH